jgi:putative transcription factor
MECELCGKESKLAKAKVEGVVVSVCENCASFGERVLEAKPVQMREKPKIVIEESVIDPKFAEKIKNARESMKLTREQLAEKIKEKLSVIEHIEHGMRPTDIVAKKIERLFGIKLLGYSGKEYIQPAQKPAELTLGDVVEIRQRKK